MIYRLIGITVYVLKHPNIRAGICSLPAEFAVPFIQPVSGEEYSLPEPVVNRKPEVSRFVCIKWIEKII